jgi:Ca2+:H+ antiporter
MSYFAGGLRFHEQLYAQNGAQMHISLLGISLIAIVLPAAYHYAWPQSLPVAEAARYGNTVPEGKELGNLLKMSRCVLLLSSLINADTNAEV